MPAFFHTVTKVLLSPRSQDSALSAHPAAAQSAWGSQGKGQSHEPSTGRRGGALATHVALGPGPRQGPSTGESATFRFPASPPAPLAASACFQALAALSPHPARSCHSLPATPSPSGSPRASHLLPGGSAESRSQRRPQGQQSQSPGDPQPSPHSPPRDPAPSLWPSLPRPVAAWGRCTG